MNLFLHGAKDVQIVQGDTLRSPAFLEAGQLRTFDCVIANPPFSLKNWGADQFCSDIYGRNMWGSPTDSNADFAWLQHMICSMDKKNGRLVDLKHFHKVQLETKEECGETYKVYTAYDYVSGKRIELQYDSSKQQWYFENASEYVRIPLDLLVKISQKPYHGSIINI